MRSLPSASYQNHIDNVTALTSLTSTVNALKNDGQKCDQERECVEGLAKNRLGADHLGSISTAPRLLSTCGGSAIRAVH